LEFQIPISITETGILRRRELHFSSWSVSCARKCGFVASREDSKVDRDLSLQLNRERRVPFSLPVP